MQKSYTYQMIPLPNAEKQDFKEYDISILLISYKREYNIPQIVEQLSKQTYKGIIELIIWNNSQ